jgi:hypothetical protein
VPHPAAAAAAAAATALLESYEDQERLVWEQLSGLVTDAAWLESYAAAVIIKFKEAFQVGGRACCCDMLLSLNNRMHSTSLLLRRCLAESYAAAAMIKVKEAFQVGRQQGML